MVPYIFNLFVSLNAASQTCVPQGHRTLRYKQDCIFQRQRKVMQSMPGNSLPGTGCTKLLITWKYCKLCCDGASGLDGTMSCEMRRTHFMLEDMIAGVVCGTALARSLSQKLFLTLMGPIIVFVWYSALDLHQHPRQHMMMCRVEIRHQFLQGCCCWITTQIYVSHFDAWATLTSPHLRNIRLNPGSNTLCTWQHVAPLNSSRHAEHISVVLNFNL